MATSPDEHVGGPEQAFSYIRRRGRFTQAQARAYENLVEQYRVTPEHLIAHSGPIGLEIGFGMGAELLAWAQQSPDWYLCGVELYQPGIGAMLTRLKSRQLPNVGLIDQPAQLVLAALPAECLSEVRIFFPDPWPKKRHFKRRLVQVPFVMELQRVIKPGSVVRLATDWEDYGEWMVEQFEQVPGFQLLKDQTRKAHAAEDAAVRSTTKFEARGERLGHDIRDLVYVKSQQP
ncbi:MAG: tRNA (guanosine(46)-N7)-methyltransferase TrmB [Pseudomonadota bacterium]|nr:tRNA (guanosine(46)-N7)-methyltransferase TrmB [Pseudomonadota bacterium]